MSVCAFLVPVISSSISILGTSLEDTPSLQDEISIAQLRHIMNVSDDFIIAPDAVSFHYHGDACILTMVNEKLIMKPGTVIFLTDIDAVSFREDNGLLMLAYDRSNKHEERTIARI